MKIAYLSTEYPPLIFGGLGVYVDSITRQLTALDQKISVFSWGNAKLPRHEIENGVEVFRQTPVPMKDGLEIFLSPKSLAWGDGLRFMLDLFSFNQLSAAGILQEGPFDLAVAHDWLGLPGGMAVRSEGVPLIYHVHGLEDGRSEAPNPQLVALERRGTMVADLVMTVSEAMKQELVRLGADPDKVRVCYHGVDSGFFDPERVEAGSLEALRRRFGFDKEDIIALFMGRLEPVKGIVQLLSAVPRVLEAHPNFRLLVVGKGSLEEWTGQAAARLGCVTLVNDFLNAEDKMHIYALADLCVFPSIYEPFGIVALEAAAMGKASVVGAAGTSGLREIVQNPSTALPTGVHVNARQPDDIAWGINLALEDLERLKSWGMNARRRAKETFSWQAAAKKTLEIYREVI